MFHTPEKILPLKGAFFLGVVSLPCLVPGINIKPRLRFVKASECKAANSYLIYLEPFWPSG
jgi:hypothetical protein